MSDFYGLSELFEDFIFVHPAGHFALAQGEMCSKGTVSARDSFVYISEAVLSNHGAAPETNRPENMQCLTVSVIKPFSLFFCVCVCVKLTCAYICFCSVFGCEWTASETLWNFNSICSAYTCVSIYMFDDAVAVTLCWKFLHTGAQLLWSFVFSSCVCPCVLYLLAFHVCVQWTDRPVKCTQSSWPVTLHHIHWSHHA